MSPKSLSPRSSITPYGDDVIREKTMNNLHLHLSTLFKLAVLILSLSIFMNISRIARQSLRATPTPFANSPVSHNPAFRITHS